MLCCIACKTDPSEYRCSKCFERYCIVTCCPTHKALCIEFDDNKKASPNAVEVKHMEKQCYEGDNHLPETDQVPEYLLQELGNSSEIA